MTTTVRGAIFARFENLRKFLVWLFWLDVMLSGKEDDVVYLCPSSWKRQLGVFQKP